MTKLIVRIDLGEAGRIGPGKILLLEMIAAHGSISAAGRAMGLPYRHAWELVEQLNTTFREPVVARQTGGRHGGGAALTPAGAALLGEFVALRAEAERAVGSHLAAIARALRPAARPPPTRRAADRAGAGPAAGARAGERDRAARPRSTRRS